MWACMSSERRLVCHVERFLFTLNSGSPKDRERVADSGGPDRSPDSFGS